MSVEHQIRRYAQSVATAFALPDEEDALFELFAVLAAITQTQPTSTFEGSMAKNKNARTALCYICLSNSKQTETATGEGNRNTPVFIEDSPDRQRANIEEDNVIESDYDQGKRH